MHLLAIVLYIIAIANCKIRIIILNFEPPSPQHLQIAESPLSSMHAPEHNTLTIIYNRIAMWLQWIMVPAKSAACKN